MSNYPNGFPDADEDGRPAPRPEPVDEVTRLRNEHALRLGNLVRLLDLEPMGGREDGAATWDDVEAYVAKALGTRAMGINIVRNRSEKLAATLGAPASTSWTRLIELVELLVLNAGGPATQAQAEEWKPNVLNTVSGGMSGHTGKCWIEGPAEVATDGPHGPHTWYQPGDPGEPIYCKGRQEPAQTTGSVTPEGSGRCTVCPHTYAEHDLDGCTGSMPVTHYGEGIGVSIPCGCRVSGRTFGRPV